MFKFLQNVGSCGVSLEMKVLPDTEIEGTIDGHHVAVFLRRWNHTHVNKSLY